MNPALPSSLSDLGVGQYGYPTSDPESTHGSSASGKKRASRAGTRSVSTLSAAQLDRKRANDREAQRAIRQRTKDHIESLEKTICDLRGVQEASDKTLAVTQQRSRELQEENAYLRAKLNEAGIVCSADPHQAQTQADFSRTATRTNSSATHASVSSSTESASHLPGALSIVPPQLAGHQPSFWQQPQPTIMQVQSAPASLHNPNSAPPIGHHLPNWRSHDGSQNMPGTMQEVSHPQSSTAQSAGIVPHYAPQWSTPAQQPHSFHTHGHGQTGHALVTEGESTTHRDPPYAHQSSSPIPPLYNPVPRVQQPQQPQPYQQQAPGAPTLPSPTPPPPQTAFQDVHGPGANLYQQQQQQQYQLGSAAPLSSPAIMGSGSFGPVDPSQTTVAFRDHRHVGHAQQQYAAYRGEGMGPPPSHQQQQGGAHYNNG